MRQIRRIAAASAVLALAGCASIVSHSNWPVAVHTAPEGGVVKVSRDNGVVIHEAATPFTVTLASGDGWFGRAGYVFESRGPLGSGTTNLTANLNGWYFGNIVFGGLIGIVIVDPATGAMWRLPETVTVPLSPTTATTPR